MIVKYNITGVAKFAKEMAEKGLNKPKVSLQFELSTSGIASLIKAEAAVEEIIMVTEEVDEEEEGEVESAETDEKDEASESNEDTAADEATEESAEEEKQPEKKEKKKKTKTVEKETKKNHKRTLKVEAYYNGKVQPHSETMMKESQEKLQYLEQKDRERIMLEESRNKVESYIYYIKNKLNDDEDEIAKITNEEQRSSILSMAMEAEDWLYEDGYDADLATFEDKFVELSEPAEAIFFRQKEMTARPEAIAKLNKMLSKIEDLMNKWETEKPQVTEEERTNVLGEVEVVRKWISDMLEKQENTDPTDTPAFTSEEVPLQTKKIESLVSRLSR